MNLVFVLCHPFFLLGATQCDKYEIRLRTIDLFGNPGLLILGKLPEGGRI
jgi:hypothetical protein